MMDKLVVGAECFINTISSFKSTVLKTNLSGIPSECQTIWMKIGPDLGLNCLQRLSANNTNWQKVKIIKNI